MNIDLLSVNIGEPRSLGTWKGRKITSSIAKVPVISPDELELGELGLEGNQQADLRVHGGVDKAVYAYPSEHWDAWTAELGRLFGPASFGENLTIAGITESDVRIGDQWAWGNALLEVTKPRQPCYKLIMFSGIEDIIQRMRASLRTGWYLKVVRPGAVPVAGPLVVVHRGDGETIRDNMASKTKGPISEDFFG